MKRLLTMFLCMISFWTYSQKLVRAEYFIDKDPGPGKGFFINGITKTDSLDIKNINISSIGLTDGPHILGLRVRDSLGMWSANYISSFSIFQGSVDLSNFNKSKLVKAEYFIDKDPGPGKGVPIAGITKGDSLDIKNISIQSTGLTEGSHLLGLRVRDSLGFWSASFITSFSILKGNGNLSEFNQSKLVRAEYFVDKDPGPGKGVSISGIIKGDSLNIKNVSIPSTGLAEGSHIIGLRVRDSLGMWSATFISSFGILQGNGNLNSYNPSKLVRAEYFIDRDPGPGRGVAVPGILKADSIDFKNLSVPTLGLAEGFHILGLRVRDSLGLWSANFISSFRILKGGSISDTVKRYLIKGEYFFGMVDPGLGKGTLFTTPAKDENWDISNLSIDIPDTLGLSLDNYFTFRIKQDNGLWSANQTVKFDVCLSIVTKPTATGITICGGPGSGTLKASGLTSKQYAWFTDSWDKSLVKKTSTIGSKTDTSFTTNFSEPSTDYWIAGYNGVNAACPYGLRTKVTAEVVQALASPTIGTVSRCGAGRVTLKPKNTPPLGGTFRWFLSDTSQHYIVEGDSLITDSLIQSRTFFVETISSGGKCKSPTGKYPVVQIKTCKSQVITFPFVQDLVFGFDTSVILKAQSESGLPVFYELISGPARFINDSTLVLTGVGEITIKASQPGDNLFEPAASVIKRFKALAGSSTVIIDYTSPICTGSELKLFATAIKNGNYFWRGPNGFSSTDQSPSVFNVSLADSGKYSVVVQSPTDTLFASVFIPIFKSPLKITLYSKLINKCAREYQAFTEGDSIIRFQWYFNAKKILGAVDSSLVPSITGVYSVNGFNSDGCSISSSPVYINVDPDSIPLLTRLRKPSRLHAPLAQNYKWFINNYMIAGTQGQDLPILFNGNYRVLLTDTKGCERFSPDYNVFDDGLPDLRVDNLNKDGLINLEMEISGISIIPQPSDQSAEIIWSSPKRGTLLVELTDSFGKRVYQTTLDKNMEIFSFRLPVQNLSNGLYYVHLICEGKQINANILVAR